MRALAVHRWRRQRGEVAVWPGGGAARRRSATFEATIYICVAYLVASVAQSSWGVHTGAAREVL